MDPFGEVAGASGASGASRGTRHESKGLFIGCGSSRRRGSDGERASSHENAKAEPTVSGPGSRLLSVESRADALEQYPYPTARMGTGHAFRRARASDDAQASRCAHLEPASRG